MQEYFSPVDSDEISSLLSELHDSLIHKITFHDHQNGFPSLEGIKLAIVGVPEYRACVKEVYENVTFNPIRKKLYQLKHHSFESGIADLGNIILGDTPEDTFFALSAVVNELVKQNIVPIIIGGSHDLTYAQYQGYAALNKIINMAVVDSRFDLGGPEDNLNSLTFIGKIVLEQPSHLFNLSVIGYQTYFVGQEAVDLMERMYFDTYRLGTVRSEMNEMEPVIRGADMMSFDMCSIKQSDCPGTTYPSANGLTGDEACQLMRYAGMNDLLSSVGLFEYYEAEDRNGHTASLIAEMIWYFIEGFENRKAEMPVGSTSNFITYKVPLEQQERDLVFLKSKKSDRWWMELIHPNGSKGNERKGYIPCSYKDYHQACQNEIPDKWWQTLNKLSE